MSRDDDDDDNDDDYCLIIIIIIIVIISGTDPRPRILPSIHHQPSKEHQSSTEHQSASSVSRIMLACKCSLSFLSAVLFFALELVTGSQL